MYSDNVIVFQPRPFRAYTNTEGWRAWLQLLKYDNLYQYDNITLSHCPDHSFAIRPLLQQTPMHGVFIKWCCQPRFISIMSWLSAGGPCTCVKADHPWKPYIVGPGDHLQQHNLSQMVRETMQLWLGITFGVTVHRFVNFKIIYEHKLIYELSVNLEI